MAFRSCWASTTCNNFPKLLNINDLGRPGRRKSLTVNELRELNFCAVLGFAWQDFVFSPVRSGFSEKNLASEFWLHCVLVT